LLVEILVTDGCPHEELALELVSASARRLGVRPVVDLVEISDLDEASALRFVGSPTIRVNGQDVAPASGRSGLPDDRTVREAMATALAAELNV
jgi:hypothetical protein